jgi:hypothetical protein
MTFAGHAMQGWNVSLLTKGDVKINLVGNIATKTLQVVSIEKIDSCNEIVFILDVFYSAHCL